MVAGLTKVESELGSRDFCLFECVGPQGPRSKKDRDERDVPWWRTQRVQWARVEPLSEGLGFDQRASLEHRAIRPTTVWVVRLKAGRVLRDLVRWLIPFAGELGIFVSKPFSTGSAVGYTVRHVLQFFVLIDGSERGRVCGRWRHESPISADLQLTGNAWE